MREAFDEILRFWFDRGVAGFRIDVCNIIIKDAELRDNPPATEDDDFEAQLFGQRPVYNANRPEVHEVIRRWRRLADAYEPDAGPDRRDPRAGRGHWSPITGTDDELHLAFNFPFIERAVRGGARCDRSSRRPRRPCPPEPGRPGPARTTTCPVSQPGGPQTTRDGPGWLC